MDAFLQTYKLPKLTQEEIENLNRPITSKETESVVKNPPRHKKCPGPGGPPEEFYQIYREELISILLRLFQKKQKWKASKLIIWDQHYLDHKTRQRPHQKGELQTNIPDEYGPQNSQ